MKRIMLQYISDSITLSKQLLNTYPFLYNELFHKNIRCFILEIKLGFNFAYNIFIAINVDERYF